MTRVGTRTSRSPGVRSGLAWMATSWRIVPSGLTLRSMAVRTIPPISSASKCGPAMSRNPSTREPLRLGGVLGARRRHRHGHRGEQARRHGAVPAVAGVGHDRAEAEHPLGVVDGQLLGDHPAHRHADDVRRRHVEVVEQRHGIRRHVGEEVVRLRVAAVRERP